MPEKIRLIKTSDLIQLQNLYNERKTVSELNWLLQDPDDSNKLNGYVAVNEDEVIVGMIGFTSSNYRCADKELAGVVPMSWKIKDGYKGMAGITLFKKVFQHGDFTMTIEGSDLAQSIYPMFGLTNIGYSHTCMKLLKPLDYFLSLKNKPFYKRAGNLAIMSKSFVKKPSKLTGLLNVYKVDIDHVNKDIPYLQRDYLEKQMSANYIKWLMQCPVNDSLGFEIYNGEVFVGYSVCYIHRVKNRFSRGRIVYMPNFGANHQCANELITYLTNYLKEQGCSSISMSLMDLNLLKASKDAGYIDYTSKDKPIFIKPSNILDSIGVGVDNWYMQYTEGDKAYRNI